MEYRISDKMSGLQPSAIREIFKFANDPGVISLAGGNPAPEALPIADIQELMCSVLAEAPLTALLYNQSEGYPPLREALRGYLAEHYGIAGNADDILVVSGAQQGLDLVCKVLLNEGDGILVEEPSFIGALNCFRSYNAQLFGVPLEEDGMDLEILEQTLVDNPQIRLIYLIPNFQNPTGFTTSPQKRKAIYALAKQYNVLILEDNPYGDLRFRGTEVPQIKTLDEDGRVIYIGSFSKVLSTGIRVGYLVAPKELTGKLAVAKQCTDVHTSMPAQMLCHRFLTQRDLWGHIMSAKSIYAHKCDLMLSAMDREFPVHVTYSRPEGGVFIWAALPDDVDTMPVAQRLVEECKVCVVPGNAFLTKQGGKSNALRFNFTAGTDEQIEEGIRRIAPVLHDICTGR